MRSRRRASPPKERRLGCRNTRKSQPPTDKPVMQPQGHHVAGALLPRGTVHDNCVSGSLALTDDVQDLPHGPRTCSRQAARTCQCIKQDTHMLTVQYVLCGQPLPMTILRTHKVALLHPSTNQTAKHPPPFNQLVTNHPFLIRTTPQKRFPTQQLVRSRIPIPLSIERPTNHTKSATNQPSGQAVHAPTNQLATNWQPTDGNELATNWPPTDDNQPIFHSPDKPRRLIQPPTASTNKRPPHWTHW